MLTGPHTVSLDKERQLVFDFAAFRRIENLTGCSFLTGNPGTVAPDSMEYLLIVLWAGLLKEDPSLTLSQVEGMLSFENIVAVDAACGAALQAALGKARGAPQDGPQATKSP